MSKKNRNIEVKEENVTKTENLQPDTNDTKDTKNISETTNEVSDEKEKYEVKTVVPGLLNIRSKASIDGKIKALVDKGDRLKVIETKNEWSHVELENKIVGWCMSEYLA